jgi:hypothetical protein
VTESRTLTSVEALAEFALARIAEDEQRVYRCDSDGEFRVTWVRLHEPDGSLRYTTVAADHRDGNWCADGTNYAEILDEVDAAEPFYDARRVLAECEAKRRIVKYALSWAGEFTGTQQPIGGPYGEAMLRALVQTWKDHPDFNAHDWLI